MQDTIVTVASLRSILIDPQRNLERAAHDPLRSAPLAVTLAFGGITCGGDSAHLAPR